LLHGILIFYSPLYNIYMPVYRSFEDGCWKLLTGLRMDSFFDEHGIPPVILPLLLFMALALIIFTIPSFSSTIPPMDSCGDGICDPEIGENILTCPQDCTRNYGDLKDLKVEVLGDLKSIIKITVTDENNNLLQTEIGRVDSILLEGLTAGWARASATNPLNSETISSELTELVGPLTIITLGLPPNFFKRGATSDLSVPLEDFIPTYVEIRDTDGNLLDIQYLSSLDDLNLTNGSLIYLQTEHSNDTWVSTILNGSISNQSIMMSPLVDDLDVLNCSDSTPAGYCSLEPPYYCSASATLIENCAWCGCPAGEECMESGSCNIPSVPTPSGELNCINIPGDLDGDGVITINDIAHLTRMIDEISSRGFSQEAADNIICADANSDGHLTLEDLECLNKVLDGAYTSVSQCPACNPSSVLEICNDGVDNNCDGQTDRDTYNLAEGRYYGFPSNPEDICSCISLTPCDMIRVNSEFSDPADESSIQRCMSLSGSDGGQYHWYSYRDWRCDPGKNGWTLMCDGKSYVCSSLYDWWSWRDSGNNIYGNLTWVKKAGDNTACNPIDGGINCPHSGNCDFASPGFFNIVRGRDSGEGWAAECSMRPENCECRCNRDKLYCADSTNTTPQQSCWVPSGDYLCSAYSHLVF
jgi:hypothetical protein